MRNDSPNGGKRFQNITVVVFYEDHATREEAVKFCDALVKRFWSDYGFDVNWWSFAQLNEFEAAKEASLKAAQAPLIVFAASPQDEIPAEIHAWLESWLSQRGDREGALVGLLDPAAISPGLTSQKYVYLRNITHRAGMDYLTHVPENISRCIPDSIESYNDRAQRVTSVLDEILRQQPPPPPQMLSA